MQLPLSRDEYAALARVLSAMRKQLQDVSDLLSTRYGKDSGIAESAVKTLVSTTLLEHEFLQLDNSVDPDSDLQENIKGLGHSAY